MNNLVQKGKTHEFNSKFMSKLQNIPGILPDFWKSDFRTAGSTFAANLKHSTWWYKDKPISDEFSTEGTDEHKNSHDIKLHLFKENYYLDDLKKT